MVDLAGYAEITRLLDELAAVEHRLAPNERELYRRLRAHYETPGPGSFEDRTCLEVMLRNVRIREGHGVRTGERADRLIEVERRKGGRKR